MRPRHDVLLHTLERLLMLPAASTATALAEAADLVAHAIDADKVDAFLYEPARDSLVATGTSRQLLSDKQKRHGLDVLPIANGGRAVEVFRTRRTYASGHVDRDHHELPGMRHELGIHSAVAVPLVIAGTVRGVLMVASTKPDHFDDAAVSFVESVGHWVGALAHRAELVEHIRKTAGEEGRKAGADELVTVLAHDLRNHLAPLDVRIDMIRRRAERESRTRDADDARAARKTIARIATLVDDVLDVARVDRGIFSLRVAAVDLNELLEETVATMSTPTQPVELRIAEQMHVAGDGARLRQCIENVVANGLKHSPRGVPVVIDAMRVTEEAGDVAVIDVVDEGPGIEPDVLPRIFERYVTTTSPQNAGGLGLGLYLAKRIAVLHGGELAVESAPGRGARFRLRLPCWV